MKSMNKYLIEYFVKQYFNNISKSEKSRFLDLGCGIIPYKRFYQGKYQEIITADYEKRTEEVDMLADAQNLPFEDNYFDCILFSEVIEHVPDPEKAVQEISRCLKNGGQLILTFPFIYNLHEVPYDFQRYTEFGIERLLHSKHLKITKLLRRGNIFSVIMTLSAVVVELFLEFLYRLPVVGIIFAPIKFIALNAIQGIFHIHAYFVRNSKRLNFDSVGLGLRGVGALTSWHLGYCIVATKAA
jgi:SAM-dependent methyltransferase